MYNGTNKTFFFAAYEGYRLRQASTRSISVFTPAFEQGDYSKLTDSSGRPITIYDPWSVDANYNKTPYPNNQIPISFQAPLSKYLYSVTPLPTTADNPLVNSNWFGLGFNKTNQLTETIKIDHVLSERDHLSFRQSHLPSYQSATSSPYGQSPNTTDMLANIAVHAGQNDSGVANWTHNFSPTFFGETLVTVSRDYTAIEPATGNQEIDSKLGFPNPFNGFGFPRLPYSLNTATSTAISYDSCCNPNVTFTHYFNIDQNFTKIKGRHEFQFGVRFRWETLNELEDQHGQQGELDYNNVSATAILNKGSGNTFTAQNFTGSVAAQFFLGLGAYNARFNRQAMPVKDSETALYFQDNFKVNSRLTLNLGLRYEINVVPYFTDNSGVSFDAANHKIVLGTSLDKLIQLKDVNPLVVAAYQTYGLQYETAQQAGLPSSLVRTNYLDFNPRAGFAYRITTGRKPLVVRGGFSQFGYPEPGRLFTAQFSLTQPYLGVFQNNPNSASLSPDGLSNYFLRAAPTIVAGKNSADALNLTSVTIAPGGGQMFYLNPDQPTEKSMQWNLTFEKEVMSNTAVRVGYIGQHGYNAPTIDDYNEPIPSYVWYTNTHQPLPTGTFAGVLTRTYDTDRRLRRNSGVRQSRLVEYFRIPGRGRTSLREGLRLPAVLCDEQRDAGRRRFVVRQRLQRRTTARTVPAGHGSRQPPRPHQAPLVRSRSNHSEACSERQLPGGPAVRQGQAVRPQQRTVHGCADRRLADGRKPDAQQQLYHGHDELLWTVQQNSNLRQAVSDPELHERRLLQRIPLLERLHPGEPDQSEKCSRPVYGHLRHPVELPAFRAAVLPDTGERRQFERSQFPIL